MTSLRSQLIEAGARVLVGEGRPLGRIDATAALDAFLDSLEANAEEWRDIQKDYPQLYEVAESKQEHMMALGILPSAVSHQRITSVVVAGLIQAIRDTGDA